MPALSGLPTARLPFVWPAVTVQPSRAAVATAVRGCSVRRRGGRTRIARGHALQARTARVGHHHVRTAVQGTYAATALRVEHLCRALPVSTVSVDHRHARTAPLATHVRLHR